MRADEVRSVTFRQRLRGYQVQDVDAFIERAAQALDIGESVAAMCDQARFRQSLRGYDVEQVDGFLEQLAMEVI